MADDRHLAHAVSIIARAIRTARNDALEEAAVMVDRVNAGYAAEYAKAKAEKNRFKARDFESMRIATAALGAVIRARKSA